MGNFGQKLRIFSFFVQKDEKMAYFGQKITFLVKNQNLCL